MNFRKVWLIFSLFLFGLAEQLYGLQMIVMPENLQTQEQEPKERTISLKLPIEQAAYHWTFVSREDFLSGKLILYINRDNQTKEIVIFENGKIADGWDIMTELQIEGAGEIYFGFISTAKYLTAPGDELKLELTVEKDLNGIGPLQAGLLPVGTFISKGSYSGLIDEYDISALEKQLAPDGDLSDEHKQILDNLRLIYNNKAFLENWQEQWPVLITSQQGWLPEEQAAAMRKTLEQIEEAASRTRESQERLKNNQSEIMNDKTKTFKGIVRDEKGQPVSDAIVTIHHILQREEPRTDENGKFSIDADMRYIRDNEIPLLLIRHKERNLAAAVGLEVKTEDYEITLSPGITLSGKVVDVNGVGIRNATLELIIWMSEHGRNKSETVEIDENGNFKITALPAGYKYSVLAKADGYGQDYADIQTSQTPGDNYELNPIVLQVANLSVSGIVVDNNDKPVADADIFCEGYGQQIYDTRTDDDGSFTITNLCEGTIRIEAYGSAFTGSIATEAGTKEVKIVISERDSSNNPSQVNLTPTNKSIEEILDLISDFNSEQARDKCVLLCFFDYEQRPSRNTVLQLAERVEDLTAKDIAVILMQASKIEKTTLDNWLKENNINLPVGMIEENKEQTKFNYGVHALPWLILTDKEHIVTDEGFSINELDERIVKLTDN